MAESNKEMITIDEFNLLMTTKLEFNLIKYSHISIEKLSLNGAKTLLHTLFGENPELTNLPSYDVGTIYFLRALSQQKDKECFKNDLYLAMCEHNIMVLNLLSTHAYRNKHIDICVKLLKLIVLHGVPNSEYVVNSAKQLAYHSAINNQVNDTIYWMNMLPLEKQHQVIEKINDPIILQQLLKRKTLKRKAPMAAPDDDETESETEIVQENIKRQKHDTYSEIRQMEYYNDYIHSKLPAHIKCNGDYDYICEICDDSHIDFNELKLLSHYHEYQTEAYDEHITIYYTNAKHIPNYYVCNVCKKHGNNTWWKYSNAQSINQHLKTTKHANYLEIHRLQTQAN